MIKLNDYFDTVITAAITNFHLSVNCCDKNPLNYPEYDCPDPQRHPNAPSAACVRHFFFDLSKNKQGTKVGSRY